MRPLHAGVDTTVIALWLGHEDPSSAQAYLKADLALKERVLAKNNPADHSARTLPARRPTPRIPRKRASRKGPGFESLRFRNCDQHER
jgi:hypothetical protein